MFNFDQVKLKKVVRVERKEISFLHFEEERKEWRNCEGEKMKEARPNIFSVMTLNIMKEGVNLEGRMKALRELIHKKRPTFVLLQENQKDHMNLLMGEEEIRKHYFVSSFECQEEGFKTSLFCSNSLKVLKMEFLDAFGRSAVLCTIQDEHYNQIDVVSCHLTSGNNAGKRKEQVEFLHNQFRETNSNSSIIIGGDFNACKPEEDDLVIESGGYLDCWKLVKGSEEGFTRRGARERLDRITLKSEKYTCESIEIIADEKVDCKKKEKEREKNKRVESFDYISDHLGLFAKFRTK